MLVCQVRSRPNLNSTPSSNFEVIGAQATFKHLTMANVALDNVNQVTSEEINRKVQHKMDQLNKDWANLPKEHNLSKFSVALKDIIEKAGYNEMYGVELVAASEEE